VVKIEYQYKNGESVLDSCNSCTGLELIIDTSNYELCGQRYFELKIVEVVYDDMGNQIIYFNYNDDIYGTTMTYNDFITATNEAYECPPNSQCTQQETSFNWSVTPVLGAKYVSDNIVRPVGTLTDYTYSFIDITINATPYTLGVVWDDTIQGKACDNTKDYIDAIINYLNALAIPELVGAVNIADNGMTNNFNGDNLLELYFVSGTSVSIQIQDTGSNVGTFNYLSTAVTQAELSVVNTSVVDTGDIIVLETLEVTDGQLFRSTDNLALPLSIYSIYGFEYNFNLANALIVALCIDTQSECVIRNFVQILITPTQMASVLGGATISGSTTNSNTAPVNTLAPSLYGVAAEGGILSVYSGLWIGFPTPILSYDWQYSSDGGITWNSYAPPEIGTSYLVQTSDIGNLIRCEVTGTNIVGNDIAYTNSVAIVAGGNCPPSNITLPSISGLLPVGSVLTTTNGTWSGSPSYSYKWLRNGQPISGALASTYTTTTADAGQVIQSLVIALNLSGQNEVVSSNSIIPTLAPFTIDPPIVYGDVALGSTLSVYDGVYGGYPSPTFAYNWQYSTDSGVTWNNYSPVQIGATYTIVSGDIGNMIRCQVDITNSQGTISEDSNAVDIPIAYTPTSPSFAVNPVINILGAFPMEGVYLEVTDGVCNGSDPISFLYQWKNNGVNILGETDSTYLIQLTDYTDTITCEVTATNGITPDATYTPSGVVVVQKPINTVAPVVSGLNVAGNVLTTTDGTWTGNATITFSYQWYRDCYPISGAITNSYTSSLLDERLPITCVVTGINAYGVGDATSNALTIQAPPLNLQPPVIYGAWTVGSVLTVQDGYYSGFPIPTIARKWQFSTDSGVTWNDYAPPETGTTYTIVTGDVGRLIRVFETATNPITSVNTPSNNANITSTAQPPNISGTITISGVKIVGQTLTASVAGLTISGTPTPTPTYQWYRGDNAISGATSLTYTLVASDAGENVWMRATYTNTGGNAYVDSSFQSIFLTIADKYPSGASHGWWMFLLKGSYYGSPCIRVRKGTGVGATQQDIGFDANGYLNIASIISFGAGADVFVHTVYDQLGGANFTQSNEANQYRIGIAGSPSTTIEAMNGIVAMNNIIARAMSVVGSAAAGTFTSLHNGSLSAWTLYSVESAISSGSNSQILYNNASLLANTGIIWSWQGGGGTNFLLFAGNGANYSINSTVNTGMTTTGTQTLFTMIVRAGAVAGRRYFIAGNNNMGTPNVQSTAVGTANASFDLWWGNTANNFNNNRKQGMIIYKNESNVAEIQAIIRSQLSLTF
jgi:hypothetical protein